MIYTPENWTELLYRDSEENLDVVIQFSSHMESMNAASVLYNEGYNVKHLNNHQLEVTGHR